MRERLMAHSTTRVEDLGNVGTIFIRKNRGDIAMVARIPGGSPATSCHLPLELRSYHAPLPCLFQLPNHLGTPDLRGSECRFRLRQVAHNNYGHERAVVQMVDKTIIFVAPTPTCCPLPRIARAP